MAGVRNVAAHRIDDDVGTLLAHLNDYFALQQPRPDMDLRATVVQWLIGKLICLDNATALAVRTTNLEESRAWNKTLVQLDGLAQP